MLEKTKTCAIFASGTGSNAANIVRFFGEHGGLHVSFVLSNNSKAGVVSLMHELGVEVFVLSNAQVNNAQTLINLCEKHSVDVIILAGFLRKLPSDFVARYQQKIVNLHPSLLPKYGGKGMYGERVHLAVLQNNERTSGISIHFVDADFDTGDLIAQFSCKISENETVDTLKSKIHSLEHAYYPWVIKQTFLI